VLVLLENPKTLPAKIVCTVKGRLIGSNIQGATVVLMPVGTPFVEGDPGVYTYIAESLARFPDRRQLAMMFRSHDFEVQSSTLLFCGIVQRITLRKSDLAQPTPAKPESS